MANQALSSMKLRTLIRFKQEGRTHQFIGKTLGLSRTTVVKYVQFLELSGLDWTALSALDDQACAAFGVPARFTTTATAPRLVFFSTPSAHEQ